MHLSIYLNAFIQILKIMGPGVSRITANTNRLKFPQLTDDGLLSMGHTRGREMVTLFPFNLVHCNHHRQEEVLFHLDVCAIEMVKPKPRAVRDLPAVKLPVGGSTRTKPPDSFVTKQAAMSSNMGQVLKSSFWYINPSSFCR